MGDERAQLDNALADVGSPAVLRRYVGKPPARVPVDCDVTIVTKSAQAADGTAMVNETYSVVIMSPTSISNAQWPGGNDDDSGVDPSLPKQSDRLIIAGRERNIDAVDPFYVAGELVRLELRVSG